MAEASVELKGVDWPTRVFYCQAKFLGDDEEHPYGQWSVRIEPMEEGRAKLDMLAVVAPKLEPGMTVELFRGARRLGKAKIDEVQTG